MDRPNMLVPLEPWEGTPRHYFPLLRLCEYVEGEERDEQRGLFFHPSHGSGWFRWTDRAPTWMDPHLLVDMALKDKRVREVLSRCLQKNSDRPAKKELPELLDEIFDQYLVYVVERFQEAKGYIVEWMARNHAYKNTGRKGKPRRQ